MKPIECSEVARLCGGTFFGDGDVTISGFATDSRDVKSGDLFIAISGAKTDGRNFVPKAMASGAAAVLSEQPVPAPHVLVKSILEGLAEFGSNLRAGFNGPVVGITGSAGKTTTKEFLASTLGTLGPVLKSPGNKNTEYTSPLVWAELTDETRFAVVELAMRGFGQIAHLAAIARPKIGIVTNIGYSHLLQVGTRAGIARAKGELLESLPDDGVAVLWREDEFLSNLLEIASSRRVATFGFSETADCHIGRYESISWSQSRVEGTCFGRGWSSVLPAMGKHVALDAAAAVLAANLCGADVVACGEALEAVTLPPMRMEVREINGATVLLDTYNASPPSMIAAIESVSMMPSPGRKIAILGNMLELGDSEAEAHAQVGTAVDRSDLDIVFFVGEPMRHAVAQVKNSRTTHLVGDRSELRQVIEQLEKGDVLLVKGSRALELEKVLES